MTVGAPAAEAKFREAIEAAKKESPNVEEYPVIYVSFLNFLIISRLTDVSGFPRFATQELALSKPFDLLCAI